MPPSVRNAGKLAIALLLTTLAACHRGEETPVQAQRIALDQVPAQGEQPLASPDTTGAAWSANGQAVDFGKPGTPPFLTLACNATAAPPTLTIIRHAPTRPGEKALFPVIGNGMIARFKMDAALDGREWHWQGVLPTDDPQLDVFIGPRPLEATLPGAGTLKIAGSAIPGGFITWCRNGGKEPMPKNGA